MKLEGILMVVQDREISIAFYEGLLGLEVLHDFGSNVELTGGVFLQTAESWAQELSRNPQEIALGEESAELCFTAEDFDEFLQRLQHCPRARLVHPPAEYRWGQRAVRLYDPDGHMVEVAESLGQVCCRFRNSGLSEEGVARRMELPLEFVRSQLKERGL